jgi:flagellar hook-length control protein FliK
MGGANNAVSFMQAYMMQGTAAVNVSNISNVSNAKNNLQAKTNGFDQVLNKVTDNLGQTRTTDVSKQTATASKDNRQITNNNTKALKSGNTDKENVTLNTANDSNTAVTENTDNVNDVTVQTVADNSVQQGNEADVTNQEAVITEEAVEVIEEIVVPNDTQDMLVPDLLSTITVDTETDTELLSAIQEDVKDLISQMTESFDISEEDIVDAMQVLGLMATDLLNPANLQQVLIQAAGQETSADLITDSDIYTSLQDLMEGAESMKSGLMNEFDLSEEELQTAIDDAGKSFDGMFQESLDANTEDATKEEFVVQEDLAPKTEIRENKKAVESVETKETPETKDTKVTRQTKAPQSEAFTEKSSVETPVEEKVEVNIQNGSTSSRQSGSKSQLGEQAQPQNLFNQVMNNIAEAAVNVSETQNTAYTDRAQMENIIRQITEKITISAGTEETSMELALHPASLGNVNILLTSGKDGITAKFTAQNQIVKEAVESQMVQLQQKFEEQGIKVTSVEVTISSHGFEQNLEQGNERRSDEANDGKRTKPLRRINLSEIEDEAADIAASDADRIAVQMMAMNGNSVDYSA